MNRSNIVEDPFFNGRIDTTVQDSIPWWPERANSKRRNLVVIILDDTGWSDLGCFGSEIATPNIDSLARRGAQFSNFHVTPLCSPTRASFLTGQNNHAIGMRFLADTDTGFPNSRGAIRAGCPLLPQTLRDNGYGTYLAGKWHLTPHHEINPSGPYHNWPLARGFDRFYGFLEGCTDQYEPELYEDNHVTDTPKRDRFHLSEELVDRSIGYLTDHTAFRSSDPFYLHLAFGATHAPFQAPSEFIQRYLEIFAKGWDQTRRDRLQKQIARGLAPAGTSLTDRNEGVVAWDELTEEEQTVFTHLQAAFAGFLEHTDAQIGRLLRALDDLGQTENTVFAVFSDNGASREGGPTGDIDTNAPYSGLHRTAAEMLPDLDRIGSLTGGAHYPEGWAMAGNTPFRLYKQFVDLGGVRSPLIIAGPDRGTNDIRTQFVHVIDLAPTLCELIGVAPPQGIDGQSVARTLKDAHAQTGRTTQYWETMGHRAIWHDGWRAVTAHHQGDPYCSDNWRLYDTRSDFAEILDVSKERPEILKQLQDLWWQEAAQHEVLPLDDRPLRTLIQLSRSHGLAAGSRLTMRPGQSHLPRATGLAGSNKNMEVRVGLAGDPHNVTGTLISVGNVQGGYYLAIDKGSVIFEHKLLSTRVHLTASRRLSSTDARLGFNIWSSDDRSASVQLVIGDDIVGEAIIPTTSSHPSFWGLDIGSSRVSGFSPLQTVPVAEGLISVVTMDLYPQAKDLAEQAEVILAAE